MNGVILVIYILVNIHLQCDHETLKCLQNYIDIDYCTKLNDIKVRTWHVRDMQLFGLRLMRVSVLQG